MKKFLLSMMSIALAASAFAFGPQTTRLLEKPVKSDLTAPELAAQSPSRATDDGYTIRYCQDIYTWYTFGNYDKYEFFLYVTPEMATQLAGNKLTKVSLSALVQSTTFLPGTIFVYEEDEEGNLQTVTETTIKVRDSYSSMLHYQVAAFDEPYEIKENTPFYFGFSVSDCAYTGSSATSDFPIAIDNGDASEFAGFIGLYQNGEFKGYALAQYELGSNLFLFGTTEGEKTSVENVIALNGISFGPYTLPVIQGASDTELTVNLYNIGDNPITSMDYTYSFDDGEPVSASAEVAAPSKTVSEVALPVSGFPEGRSNVKVTIDKFNGVEYGASSSATAIRLDGEGYFRKFFVEEATSVNCGYCPVGIVGMDYMAEEYPDLFVGVAVHSYFNGADPMELDAYEPWLEKFVSGLFPSCIFNRDPYYADSYPSKEYLPLYYSYFWETQRAPVDVEITALEIAEGSSELAVTATATFAINEENANYMMSYIVLEDQVPGRQLNYFAGGQQGECDGWENKGSKVVWNYNDVPRALDGLWGIEGSLPANIKKGTQYAYSSTIDISKVTNPQEMTVIALALDGETGVVLNATELKYTENFNSINDAIVGAKNVTVAGAHGCINIQGDYNNAIVSNLAGQRVGTTGLNAGIYLVNVDGKAYKVVVK